MANALNLPDDPAELKALLLQERQATAQLKQQVHSLLEALRLEKHRLYGKGSEKAPGQSELFDEVDAQTNGQVDASGAEAEVSSDPGKARKRAARKPLPPELPRVRKIIELSEDERRCPCGCALVEIGEAVSEQVDIIPARVQVIQTVRKKYACKSCEDTVKTAKAPAVLLPKSHASGNTMAYVITPKYADGLPLYRLLSPALLLHKELKQ